MMRDQFPVLVRNPELVYFDSASTTLKPASVIANLREYYEDYSVNVHRGQYAQAHTTTSRFEGARQRIANFIHATSYREVIFTKNATEALNIASFMLLSKHNQCVALPKHNHHSHYLPWTEGVKRSGGTCVEIRCDEHGDVVFDEQEMQALGHVDVVALTYVSNVTGRIQPIAEIVRAIRSQNPDAVICVDATQAMAHVPVDVVSLDCDMLAFSGHKMYGPTGIGVLWVRESLLEQLQPVFVGGGMVVDIRGEERTWSDIPHAFEAGTPPIAEAIALETACDFVESCDYSVLRQADQQAFDRLSLILRETDPTVRIMGEASPLPSVGIVSWYSSLYHPHDMAELLGEHNVAVRAGHHCAIPLHRHVGVPSTVRASVSCVQNENDFLAFEKAYVYAFNKLCLSTTH